MTEQKVEFLIVGAGPTGLGAAIQLERNSRDWRLFDALSYFGGLAASFVDEQGFTWDLGGHVQFSHYQEFDRWMDAALGAEGWYTHTRESWILMGGRRIPYPLQYNLHRLPPEQRWACVQGLLEVSQRTQPQARNYDEWITATLGEPFNQLFMRPYSFKVWGYPSATLDYMWVDERVAVPRLHAVGSIDQGKPYDCSGGGERKVLFLRHGRGRHRSRGTAAGVAQGDVMDVLSWKRKPVLSGDRFQQLQSEQRAEATPAMVAVG